MIKLLISQKKSRSFSIITLLSVLSLGLGLTAMIVVLNVMEGFEREQMIRLYKNQVHLVIPGRHPPIEDHRIIQASPQIRKDLLLRNDKFTTGGSLVGRQEVPAGETWISDQLAVDLRAQIGSSVILQDLTPDPGLMGAGPRSFVVTVTKIIQERPTADEREIHLPFNRAEQIALYQGHQTIYKTTTLEDAVHLADQYKSLGAQSWRDRNRTLYVSLRLERFAMAVLLGLIVLVASFSIVSSSGMLAMDKKHSMTILRALGLTQKEQFRLFLQAGCLIGGLGMALGLTLGFIVCWVLGNFNWISIPDIYVDRTLPVAMEPWYFAGPILLALVLTILASILPAKVAAKGISLTDALKGR